MISSQIKLIVFIVVLCRYQMSYYSAAHYFTGFRNSWNCRRYSSGYNLLYLAIINNTACYHNFDTGALSFASDSSDPLTQTNCTLTTFIRQGLEYPLNLHLLLTGLVLILIDVAITFLLCIVKWKKCGVLTVAWFLVMTVSMLIWILISILYLVVVFPVWLEDKMVCDYLVMLMSLVLVGYCGVLGVAYLIVIVVVLAYDCRRWHNMRRDF